MSDYTEAQLAAKRSVADYTRELLAREKPAMTYLLAYGVLRDVAREHGYALTIHGSLNRDGDFVAIAWTEDASDPQTMVAALCAAAGLTDTGRGATDKPHGRLCWTLMGVAGLPHGWIDLSVIPRAQDRA